MKQLSTILASLLWIPLVPLGTLSAQTPLPPSPAAIWQFQDSTTKASLRGIHAVGNGVAWASGTNGTILRTEDGGHMWQSCAMPPGAEKLDFRGIWAWDANTAVAMSSGPGDLSRLYKTTDGCSSWKLLYTNPDKDGFWDAVQFWDRDHGFILGDPVNGNFVFLSTTDSGKTWRRDGAPELRANPKEGAFAASNSSLAIGMEFEDKNSIFLRFGTGGPSGSRELSQSKSIGISSTASSYVGMWTSCGIPLASGTDSAGVFSLVYRDQLHGIAAGGDYKHPGNRTGTLAHTSDGGGQWDTATKPPHGYRSAVAWDGKDKAWIAAGTNGSDVSIDDGTTWQPLDNGNWNALSLPWVVGPDGRIAKLVSLDSAGKSAANPTK